MQDVDLNKSLIKSFIPYNDSIMQTEIMIENFYLEKDKNQYNWPTYYLLNNLCVDELKSFRIKEIELYQLN